MVRGMLLLILLSMFLLPQNSQAEVKASISVSPDEGSQDEDFTLTLDVWGIEDPSSVTPYLVGGDSFTVNLTGKQIGVVNNNGKTASSISFSYSLSPKETGSLEVPGAEVHVDGTILKVEPQRINVKKGSTEIIQEKGEVFLKQRVDIQQPYIGQQIVLTVDIYTAINLVQPRIDITAPGFLQEELGKESKHERLLNGIRYEVISLRRSLFPQKVGDITIPSQALTAMLRERGQRSFPFPGGIDPFDFMMGFDNVVSKTFRSPPLTVNVQPLPPSAGDAIIVGDTSIVATLSNDSLKLGDSTTLTVTVESSGDLSLLKSLPLEFPNWIKVYADSPEKGSRIKNGRLVYTRTFKISLVPTQGGLLTLDPIIIPYFDPTTSERKEAKTELLQIKVEGGLSKDSESIPDAHFDSSIYENGNEKESETLLSYLSSHVSTGLGLLALSCAIMLLTLTIFWGKISKRVPVSDPLLSFKKAATAPQLYKELCSILSPDGLPVREAVRGTIASSDAQYEIEAVLDDLERIIFSRDGDAPIGDLKDRALRVVKLWFSK